MAFLLPWLLRPAPRNIRAAGLPILAAGTGLLLWCVRDFYVVGRGTLAPWAPPERLVVVGLYRRSRNPMYLAVLTILAGWAMTFASGCILLYTGVVAIAFHLRIVFGEEPWLARAHGMAWDNYRSEVPRWLGRASVQRHRTPLNPAG